MPPHERQTLPSRNRYANRNQPHSLFYDCKEITNLSMTRFNKLMDAALKSLRKNEYRFGPYPTPERPPRSKILNEALHRLRKSLDDKRRSRQAQLVDSATMAAISYLTRRRGHVRDDDTLFTILMKYKKALANEMAALERFGTFSHENPNYVDLHQDSTRPRQASVVPPPSP